MGIYDDMFDLDDHFEKYSATEKTKEAENIKEAWERVSESYADSERYQMKVEPIVNGLAGIFNAFGVKREIKDE